MDGATYKIECGNVDCTTKDVYKGETADNEYTCGLKPLSDLRGENMNSPLWRHCRDIHNRQVQHFTMCVTGTFKNDAMLGQITEAMQINNTYSERLMNTKAEWNMTRVPRVNVSTT